MAESITYQCPEDAFEDFQNKYKQERQGVKRPTILVAGYTGAGKSSLIQAICGKSVVPDDKIAAGLPKTSDYDFYENELVRFFDSKGLESGESEQAFIDASRKFVRSLQDDANVDNHVHLVWYIIQGPGARVTPCDLTLIKNIFPNVIVLITKSDITRPDQLAAMTKVLVDSGISKDCILPCSELDKNSLNAVVDLSYDILPEAYRKAFISAQSVNLEKKQIIALGIITAAAGSAAAIGGANPLPLSDAILIAPIQVGMIAGLASLYNDPDVKNSATFLPVLAQVAGIETVASLTKMFPFIGQGINAAVAFALTGALGGVVNLFLVKRLEARANGKIPPEFNFNPKDLLVAYEEWKKKSKE